MLIAGLRAHRRGSYDEALASYDKALRKVLPHTTVPLKDFGLVPPQPEDVAALERPFHGARQRRAFARRVYQGETLYY